MASSLHRLGIVPATWMLVAVALAGATGCEALHDKPPERVIRLKGPRGPHGGSLTPWGDTGKTVEFYVDHDLELAVVRFLESDHATPAPMEISKLLLLAPSSKNLAIHLTPQPLAGEGDGVSSVFQANDPRLADRSGLIGSLSAMSDDGPVSVDVTFVEALPGSEPSPASPNLLGD